VCLTKIHTVTESTVPTIVDEGFESETGELDHHTADNTISENLSVVNNSVDIPDVRDVGVDLPTNNTCGELPKCQNVVEVQARGITVVCDFCLFESNLENNSTNIFVRYILTLMVVVGHTLTLAVNESSLKSTLKRQWNN